MGEFLEKVWHFVTTVFYALVAVLLVFVLIKSVEGNFIYSLSRGTLLAWNKEASYLGIIIGLVAYILYTLFTIIPQVEHNLNWFMKFTHELTHTLTALIFFRKIREFVVKDRECYVSYKAHVIGHVPIALSPYCIPIYTLMILPFRFTGHNKYLIFFDILIAFTYAFHMHMFIKQTRYTQSDIRGCGPVRSTTFIAATHLMFLSLLISIPKGGIWNSLSRVFYEYPEQIISKTVNFLGIL